MKTTIFTVAVFLLCTAGIAFYAFRQPGEAEKVERHRMRVIVPSGAGAPDLSEELPGHTTQENTYILKAPMEAGELVISVLNFDFNNNGIEDLVVAF